MSKTIEERFWAKVSKTSHPKGCWIWTGAKDKDGYGILHFGTRAKGRKIKAHRVSLQTHKGNPTKRKTLACHTCSNRLCVNPEHLYWGDHQDNWQDMYNEGTYSCPPIHTGEEHPNSKLTEEDVKNIRQSLKEKRTMKEISKEFDVTINAIWCIKHKKTWKHVE